MHIVRADDIFLIQYGTDFLLPDPQDIVLVQKSMVPTVELVDSELRVSVPLALAVPQLRRAFYVCRAVSVAEDSVQGLMVTYVHLTRNEKNEVDSAERTCHVSHICGVFAWHRDYK